MSYKHANKLEAVLEEKQRIEKAGRLRWFHWLIVLSSLALTLGAWSISKDQVQAKVKNQFEREAQQVVALTIERIHKYEDALWAGVAAIHSQSYSLDHNEWRNYAKALRIEKKYPGINGIGVILHVEPDEVESYLAEQRAIRPDFKIHPPHTQKELLPITYIEPEDMNAAAVGLDMAHETNRYTAAKRSRDTGLAQITGPITLVQDAQKTPGFLFYAPYYEIEGQQTVQERREKFVGLIYAPFIVKNLMQGTLSTEQRHVGVQITDDNVVLFNENHTGEVDFDPDPLYVKTIDVEMYGRDWTFEIWSKHSFRNANTSNKPSIILIGGLIIDAFLLGLFFFLALANRRALRFSNNMVEEYEEQANHLKNIINSAVDGLITIDDNGIIQSFNPACEHIFSYLSDEALGQHIDLIIPQYFSQDGSVADKAKRLMGTGYEIEGKRKSGASFPLEISMSEITVDGEKLYHGIVRDITMRKVHEAEMESATSILENSLNEIYIFDSKTLKFIQVNKGARNNIGYSLKQLQKMTPVDIKPDQTALSFNRLIEPLSSGKQKKMMFNTTHQRKDGTTYDVEVHLQRGDYKGHNVYVAMILDITERQETQRKIADAKLFQDLILNTIPDLVFVKDANFKVVQANQAFLDAYPPDMRDKIIGYTTVEKYRKEEADAFLANDRDALETGYNEVNETITFPDGTTRVVFTKKARFESDGQAYILGVARDITSMKDAERVIMQSNEELERFAYVASHDLQEPLRMVTNFTELLKKRYSEELDERAMQYIDFASDGAIRMQALVDDLLEYARLKEENERHEAIDLNELLGNVKLNLHTVIERYDAKITHDDFPTIHGNSIRFERLIQNIVSNGLKYTEQGTQPKIHIGWTEKPHHHLISIKDNGIGMKQEYCTKIFEPFKRLHGKAEYSGTGMGLAICRKIVEAMGGKIWAESTVGKGSVFYISIPKTDTKTSSEKEKTDDQTTT